MEQIKVDKGRTTIIQVNLGFDVSADAFSSEIRAEKDRESDLIAAWDVEFLSDGTDGKLVLTLVKAVTDEISRSRGFMDLKRVTGGEPISVFESPLEVLFQETITV